jgi:hypothetical protein
MQGANFVKRLFAPVPLPVVLNAIQSGWSASRVFRVFVERINCLHNAPTASGPTPLLAPEYDEFGQMTQLMALLMRDNVLTMGIAPDGNNRLIVRILDGNGHEDEICKFKKLLGLPKNECTFTFQENLLSNTEGELRLRLRSVQSAMFYLANGVRVPNEHAAAGFVVNTCDNDGRPFDWSIMLEDLLTVNYSKSYPLDAFVAIPYRGYWFYISDSDTTSKSTFMLLTTVFNLQASDPQTVAPTLALPLHR